MRLHLICDNDDTAVGMRLAGVENTRAQNADEVVSELKRLASNSDIGVVLINRTLSEKCQQEIFDFRRKFAVPMIVEIPDRHSETVGNSVADYVKEVIGI